MFVFKLIQLDRLAVPPFFRLDAIPKFWSHPLLSNSSRELGWKWMAFRSVAVFAYFYGESEKQEFGIRDHFWSSLNSEDQVPMRDQFQNLSEVASRAKLHKLCL